MILNLCRKTFATIQKCSSLTTHLMLTNQCVVTSKLLFDIKPILSVGFSSEERSPLISHKQSLPPYPHIECIVSSPDADLLKSLNYKIVKHGNYEFLASTDGYVQMYTQGYVNSREFDSKAGFAVYFGLNHPLNLHGNVERRQVLKHAKLYAFLKGFQQIPKNLFEKLCVCVDDARFITFIGRHLKELSENSFRSIHTDKLTKDLETSIEVNRIIRLRNDITLRLKYIPNDYGVDGMYEATKLAIKASEEATQQDLIKQ